MSITRTEDSSQALAKETGLRLKAARLAKGLTQLDMGNHFNMTAQGYAKYERGKNELKSTMIVKICAVLECSPSWLLGVEEEGMLLPPESKLLQNLKVAFELLNNAGQKRVVEFAEDLAGNSKYHY